MYAACAIIEASIFLSQAVWLIRTRKIRRRAKEADLVWDDFPEAQAWQGKGSKLPGNWGFHRSTKKCPEGSGVARVPGVAIEGINLSLRNQTPKEGQNGDIEQGRNVSELD